MLGKVIATAPGTPSQVSDIETTARSYKVGRALAIVNLVIATALIAGLLIHVYPDVDAVFDVIGVCAKVSMIYFIVAFTARPLNDLLHMRWTGWLQNNRRYIGLSFAAWHLQHFTVFITLTVLMGASDFLESINDVALPAGTILGVIALMAATSTDRAQRWLGMPVWSAFHTVAAYLVWAWAVRVYLQRFPDYADRHDYVYLWLLVGALVIRWIAAAKRIGIALGKRMGRS
jgi:hypothetical protein